jgi:hypothetical protein
MKAPVTLSGCGAFVVSSASVHIPKSPRFHPSNPEKTETVSVHRAPESNRRPTDYEKH